MSIYENTARPMTSSPGCPPFTISTARRGNVTVLSVCGEIDLLTIPALRQAIEGTFSEDPANLLMDLTRTTFLASAGLKALEQARGRTEAIGARFAVVTAQVSTSRSITALHLEQLLDLHTTIDEVIELWSRPDVRWPEPSPLDAWWIEVMSPKTQGCHPHFLSDQRRLPT